MTWNPPDEPVDAVDKCWNFYLEKLGRSPTTAEIWEWLDTRRTTPLPDAPEGSLPFE